MSTRPGLTFADGLRYAMTYLQDYGHPGELPQKVRDQWMRGYSMIQRALAQAECDRCNPSGYVVGKIDQKDNPVPCEHRD